MTRRRRPGCLHARSRIAPPPRMLRLKLAPDPFPDEMPYACQAARHPVVPVWNRLPQPGGFRRDRPPGAGLHS